MKKFIYLMMIMSVFLFSCTDDEVTEDAGTDNSGSVDGVWTFSSISTDVEASGTLASIAAPLLETALGTYAGNQEATYYIFEDGAFEAYADGTDEDTGEAGYTLTDYGTYTISGDSLTLTSSSSGSSYSYEIIIANDTTLKIRKSYSDSYLVWGTSLLTEYAGTSITSATVTVAYSK